MKKFIAGFAAVVLAVGFAAPAFAMTDLTLTSNCTNTPDTVLNWTVDNANGFSVPFTWDRDSGAEAGSGSVLANASTDFTTGSLGSTTPGHLAISWYDVDASTTATTTASATYTACPVVPAPVVTPIVQQPIFQPGGRRHSPEQTAAIFGTFVVSAPTTLFAKLTAELAILEQLLPLVRELDALQGR